jgi:hypothetical protein
MDGGELFLLLFMLLWCSLVSFVVGWGLGSYCKIRQFEKAGYLKGKE